MISKQSEEESKERKEEKIMPPSPLPQRKPRIRVIENVQLVPPRTAWGQQEEDKDPTKDHDETKDKEWTKISRKERRKEKRKKKGEILNQPVSDPPLPPSTGKGQKNKGKTKEVREKEPKRRIPRTSAINRKGKKDDFSYTDALRRARTNISLSELQIGSPKIRKGVNGATIIEISGPENAEKADKLVTKL